MAFFGIKEKLTEPTTKELVNLALSKFNGRMTDVFSGRRCYVQKCYNNDEKLEITIEGEQISRRLSLDEVKLLMFSHLHSNNTIDLSTIKICLSKVLSTTEQSEYIELENRLKIFKTKERLNIFKKLDNSLRTEIVKESQYLNTYNKMTHIDEGQFDDYARLLELRSRNTNVHCGERKKYDILIKFPEIHELLNYDDLYLAHTHALAEEAIFDLNPKTDSINQ